MVLTAVAELGKGAFAPPSNVDISKAAGVRDQGQISRLLRRLEGHGLLENTGGATAGVPNAWHLTPRGEEVLRASSPQPRSPPRRRRRRGRSQIRRRGGAQKQLRGLCSYQLLCVAAVGRAP